VITFFDTNVLVYAYDPREGMKRLRAQALIEAHGGAGTLVLSTQVLQESYAVLVRKGFLTPKAALTLVSTLSQERVVGADSDSVLRGLACSQRFGLSPWDGLIVQAALDAGCATLFTEDLQAGQRFGDLEVVNPFTDAAHQPRATYVAKKARKKPAAARKR
jgi:predicted nucleic acid-binding protein